MSKARFEGWKSLFHKLKKLGARKKDPTVQVGFAQSYALPVHENLTAYHRVGQAKYLETPARALKRELQDILKKVYKRTGSMEQGLLMAGLRLQREAQLLVPVDTSALKASAYTSLEADVEAASAKAYAKSEAIRQRVLASRRKKSRKRKGKSRKK